MFFINLIRENKLMKSKKKEMPIKLMNNIKENGKIEDFFLNNETIEEKNIKKLGLNMLFKGKKRNKKNLRYSINNEVLIDNSVMIPLGSIHVITKSVCKIIIPPNITATGFLIKLYKNKENFFCLMTNEHCIKKHMIKRKIQFYFYYDNEAKSKMIQLDQNKRFIKEFTNIGIDAVVIEIFPKDDEIEEEYFLEPSIYYMNNLEKLKGKIISIIQYPKNQLNLSFGKIIDIKNNELIHSASTNFGSSGSPIVLKDSIEVIGIHKSGNSIKKENYGDFIGPIFKYFQNLSENKFGFNNYLFNYDNNDNDIDFDDNTEFEKKNFF